MCAIKSSVYLFGGMANFGINTGLALVTIVATAVLLQSDAVDRPEAELIATGGGRVYGEARARVCVCLAARSLSQTLETNKK